MKRILPRLALCLAAVLLIAGLTACKNDTPGVNISNARRVVATGTTEDGLKYAIYSDNTAAITRYTGQGSEVTIPEAIDGKPVTEIGNNAFDFSTVTAVVLPDSLRTIHKWAFSNCLNLTSINLPAGLTAIDEYAFYRCRAMESFTLPQSIINLGPYAFGHCSAMTTFHLPASITAIPNGLFDHCSKLTSVTWESDITAIGEYAFASCSSIAQFAIPESVTSIGQWCFGECTSMTTIYIPSSITEIPYYALGGCKVLTDIRFGGTEGEWFAIKFDSRTFFQSCPHDVFFEQTGLPGETPEIPDSGIPESSDEA